MINIIVYLAKFAYKYRIFLLKMQQKKKKNADFIEF